ncbi:serine protease [bacterium]|nr:serine protease [bacterium]
MNAKARGLAIAAALSLGAAGGAAFANDEVDPLRALDVTFPRAAEKAQRSVVAIEVEREQKPDRPLTRGEKMQLGILGMAMYDPRYFVRPPGACTGVVVRAEKGKKALVATAAWNVRDAKSIRLVLADGTKRSVEEKGRDENLDVTILEVADSSGLEAIPFAGKAHVGQFALLVGRGGESNSPVVTAGNVSAVGRHKGDSIQISARMNYGNVGGAVVDLDGKLLGIASRLTDRPMQGLNSGVGFAAPDDRLEGELDDLASGKVVKKRKGPFMGIQGDLKPQPDSAPKGVRIEKALEGGAARKAGLKDGDWIMIFNGVETKDFMQLKDEIERLEPGDKVIVTVQREDMGQKDFTIELGERTDGSE